MSISIQTPQGLVRVAGNSFNNPMVGATETTDGKAGIVPAPLSSEKDYFLKADGTWSRVNVEISSDEILDQSSKYTDEKIEEVNISLENKVEKVSGKGLSTNDYTTEEKEKLSKIEAEAQANVQSDWDVTDATSDAFIKNKPTAMPASDVHEWAKAETKPSYTATEVGADSKGSAASALTLAKSYTDEEIEKLDIQGSLSELNDEIEELSEQVAFIDCEDNENVADAVVEGGTLNSHEHDNKNVLDKLSESADGILLFNGNEIQGGGGTNVDLTGYATIEFVNNAIQNLNIDFEDEDIDFSTDY